MSMRNLCVVCAAVFVALVAHADRDMLGSAAQGGKVRVTARSGGGHSSISVSIRNAGDEPVTVDVFGSMFLPATSRYQRLGVPRVGQDTGETLVTIAPGSEWKGSMPCFCLDGGRSSPGKGVVYRLVPKLVSKVRQEIFKLWNRYPGLSQGDVQSAVWSGSVQSLRTAARAFKPREPSFARPEGPRVVVSGGMTFVLTSEGRMRMEDYQSSSVPEPLDLGKDFCAVYATGGKVFAARNDVNSDVSLYEWRDTEWRKVASTRRVPTSAAAVSREGAVFATGGTPVTVGGVSLGAALTRPSSVSAGKFRGRKVLVGLDSGGRAKIVDLERRFSSTSGRGLRFAAAGEEIVAFADRARLLWKRPGATTRVAFPRGIRRLLVAGRHLVVISGSPPGLVEAWRLLPKGRWSKQALPTGCLDCALDGTTGELQLLMRDETVRVLRGR